MLPDLLAAASPWPFANIVNVLATGARRKLRAFRSDFDQALRDRSDLPTMAESGYPGFEAVPWFGLMAPTGNGRLRSSTSFTATR